MQIEIIVAVLGIAIALIYLGVNLKRHGALQLMFLIFSILTLITLAFMVSVQGQAQEHEIDPGDFITWHEALYPNGTTIIYTNQTINESVGTVDNLTVNYNLSVGERIFVGTGNSSLGSIVEIQGLDHRALDLKRNYKAVNYGTVLRFLLNDAADNPTVYARIIGAINDPTDGAEDGYLRFDITENGVDTVEQWRMTETGVFRGQKSATAQIQWGTTGGKVYNNVWMSLDFTTLEGDLVRLDARQLLNGRVEAWLNHWPTSEWVVRNDNIIKWRVYGDNNGAIVGNLGTGDFFMLGQIESKMFIDGANDGRIEFYPRDGLFNIFGDNGTTQFQIEDNLGHKVRLYNVLNGNFTIDTGITNPDDLKIMGNRLILDPLNYVLVHDLIHTEDSINVSVDLNTTDLNVSGLAQIQDLNVQGMFINDIFFSASRNIQTGGSDSITIRPEGDLLLGTSGTDLIDIGREDTEWQTRVLGDLNITESLMLYNLSGTYTNGEAYLCIYDNGTVFAKDSACA